MSERVSVLFVCLGNICRSPSAEAVFSNMIEKRGLSGKVRIDSAGTGDWHVGSSPDARAMEAAKRRGYDLSRIKARQISQNDCLDHDYVIVMDEHNLRTVQDICPGAKVHKLLDFAPDQKVRDVPDPYYGGDSGFDEVLDLIEEAAQGLVADVQTRLQVPAVEMRGPAA